MSENKEDEQNSATSDVKSDPDEGQAPKEEEKAVDESSKDSAKESVKEESEKSESEEEEEEEEEESTALLDRPVEVTGCRARKKVERLEISFTAPKEKQYEIPEGKGQKLGECPRIEHQIQKNSITELKPLHRILFNRVGSANEIKKNIRKFCGFNFEKESQEFTRKKNMLEKLTIAVLKHVCEVLSIERGGTKDDIVSRIMDFLLNPKDSGGQVPKKKAASKDKKKGSSKTKKNSEKKAKSKKASSDDASNDDINNGSDMDSDKVDSDASEEKPKKKSKADAKPKTKKEEKKEKPIKDEKKSTKGKKRKHDDDSHESSGDETVVKKGKQQKQQASPSDEDITKLVKQILDTADLEKTTMKNIINQVYEAYPNVDLSHKREFIKTTIKEVIS